MKTTIIVEGNVKIVEEKPKTHIAFQLTHYDRMMLIECVQSRFEEVQKILSYYDESHEVEKINNDAFDLQGLLAMLKEGVQIKTVIPKPVLKEGWTFRGHNVDMPMCYSKGVVDKNMIEEITLE